MLGNLANLLIFPLNKEIRENWADFWVIWNWFAVEFGLLKSKLGPIIGLKRVKYKVRKGLDL